MCWKTNQQALHLTRYQRTYSSTDPKHILLSVTEYKITNAKFFAKCCKKRTTRFIIVLTPDKNEIAPLTESTKRPKNQKRPNRKHYNFQNKTLQNIANSGVVRN